MAVEVVASIPAVEEVRDDSLRNGDVEVEAVTTSVESLHVASDSELHRLCAEGNVEEVRAVLSRGLDVLETLDMTTGCTPIVLAIRNNHPEVVRELLQAGAIVPPPGLTSDPLMLSLLYPQGMYGQALYPTFAPNPYSPTGAFFPQGGPEGPRGGYMPFPPPQRKEPSPSQQQQNGNGSGNLPPADVAKTILCRNFPHCKYGASCVFFHPLHQAFFRPGNPNGNGFMPSAFEGGYPAYQPNGMMQAPYFIPNGYAPPPPPAPFQDSSEQQQQHLQPIVSPASHESQIQHQQGQPASDIPDSTPSASVQSPSVVSAGAAPFIPSFQAMSPPPPSQFGLSPLSPSMLASSLPSIPPPEAFFAATSPPSGGLMPLSPQLHMNGAAPSFAPIAHRQSFSQQFGMPPKTFHGKKPSFSGGPRPFSTGRPAAGGNLGSWKDGNPPACAFFSQAKCRNGDFCKFPHLDEQGNDCRHPDVVRGLIPPLPTLSRQPRGMRMMGPGNYGSFDQALRQQQHQQQLQFLQQQRAAVQEGQQQVSDTPSTDTASPGEPTTPAEKLPVHPSVPPKPVASPLPPIARSASQPGVQRVHANGATSRSQSPAPSNVSFHGNGHPRRAGSSTRVPFVNGARSASTGANGGKAAPPQRVPGADEFPALGGLASPSGEKKESGWNKTAAQVLSAPAPVAAKPEPTNGDGESETGKSEANSVTMSSEPDSDAVIVTHKVTGSVETAPTHTQSSASFADAASKVSAPPALDSTPVSVKA
ncbi:hypothetical protein BCR39DRAFT_534866 [Naematelia encephala]|uniref:C3H1-type domain-containing protein n=1 Tax=Naematelia encephala TaxID=71784 RepID=A0A1Y2B326_9TREE|nr:hypothetical protein BCR39DRAFT_534866 [Naematelia encephala]